MIISKEIFININNKNINYYKQYFNDIKNGNKLLVPISILNKSSHINIDVKCDKCQNSKSVSYREYIKYTSKDNLYYCIDCCHIKTEKTIKEKYGVEHYSQTKEYKEL